MNAKHSTVAQTGVYMYNTYRMREKEEASEGITDLLNNSTASMCIHVHVHTEDCGLESVFRAD